MYYKIDRKLTPIKKPPKLLSDKESELWLGIFKKEETSTCGYVYEELVPNLKYLQKLRHCKVEIYENAILGALAIPRKVRENKYQYLTFYITKGRLLFFDDTDCVAPVLEKISAEKNYENPSVGRVFYHFLEYLTEEDLLYMESLENYITELEAKAMLEDTKSMNPSIMHIRKKSFVLYRYYSQLLYLSEKFIEDEMQLCEERESKLFGLLRDRFEQLVSEATMLQQYAGQVREVYQAQIDIKQNKIMCMLTIVTTIFMPLTLITGWYGMNFTHMPELDWPFSYPLVIILSIIIVVLCIIIFKRKKYL